MTEARWFFDVLFGDFAGPEAQIAVWSLPDKTTRFHHDAASAARDAVERAKQADVYFGVGLLRSKIVSGRGKANDVVAITSLWADIDYGEEHKKENIPPDIGSAIRILDAIGLPASIVVLSGHGLHAYWLLTEPREVADEAKSLAQRWSSTMQAVAKAKGHTIDNVGDLSRVLRVPGTWNRKKADAVPVQIFSGKSDPQRYHYTDLEDLCEPEPLTTSNDPPSPIHVEGLFLRLDAAPPESKLRVFLENDRRFRQTWERKRTDLPSASEYDLALANALVAGGWSDQEIADAIITWRRQHNEKPEKALRRRLMTTVILKARQGLAARQEHEKTQEGLTEAIGVFEDAADAAVTATTPEKKQQAQVSGMTALAQAIGIPVVRLVQHGGEDGDFSIYLIDGQRIHIGSVDVLLTQGRLRHRIFACTRQVMRILTNKQWHKLSVRLGALIEVEDCSDQGRAGQAEEWIAGYLDHNAVLTQSEITIQGEPFRDEGGVLHIRRSELQRHIRIHGGEQVKTGELKACLVAANWRTITVSVPREDAPRTTRTYWHMPSSTDPAKEKLEDARQQLNE